MPVLNESTEVQTLGELRMRVILLMAYSVFMRFQLVARGESDTG